VAESNTTIGPILVSTHDTRRPLHLLVVGAGGTGGRLIPPLMQMLKRGDTVAIMDGDIVEDRNLLRQNFRPRDIGRNKAEVMAQRWQREGVTVTAYASMLNETTMETICDTYPSSYRGILGCVDNTKTRQLLQQCYTRHNHAFWIDGGNERRGGQVILSLSRWPLIVKGITTESTTWNLQGMDALPQLLTPRPWHCHRCQLENAPTHAVCTGCQQPEASCRDRIDLQTVAVNHLSASCMLNMLNSILYKLPIMTCGVFFSTLNTMSPIKLKSADLSKHVIAVETTYAPTEDK
jgi:molybdopterin/thiamine biosynthesis adenylyltransferase